MKKKKKFGKARLSWSKPKVLLGLPLGRSYIWLTLAQPLRVVDAVDAIYKVGTFNIIWAFGGEAGVEVIPCERERGCSAPWVKEKLGEWQKTKQKIV